jgi:hypothetical protein
MPLVTEVFVHPPDAIGLFWATRCAGLFSGLNGSVMFFVRGLAATSASIIIIC